MGTRLQLHSLLKAIPDVKNAYFQGPGAEKMEYPCIVYSRDDTSKQHANNNPYRIVYRYDVIAIDQDPDSLIFRAIEMFPMCTFKRAYAKDQLNHQAFSIYF